MVNLMNEKILAIVEGEKKEPQLLNRLFDTYMYRKREIVAYGANIYDLYNKLLDFYGEDWEDLDFLLFLREQEKDDGKKIIFDEVYTDIFLVLGRYGLCLLLLSLKLLLCCNLLIFLLFLKNQ